MNYNISNFIAEHFDKAIDNYKNALRAVPTDEESRYNLRMAQLKLQEQQQQQQNKDNNKDQNQDQNQQNKDQNQQNQDQNQDQQNKDQKQQNQNMIHLIRVIVVIQYQLHLEWQEQEI